MLAVDFKEERLPSRDYEIQMLLRPFDFPTEAVDGIESVRVNSLRLMPIDTASQRMTLECMRSAKDTIWQMAETRFGANDPLKGGWRVTQARLTIRFHAERGEGAKSLSPSLSPCRTAAI